MGFQRISEGQESRSWKLAGLLRSCWSYKNEKDEFQQSVQAIYIADLEAQKQQGNVWFCLMTAFLLNRPIWETRL